MQRGFVFTLNGNTQNLWDLISATFTDPYFQNSAFVPNQVNYLKIYFPVSGPNSINNAGENTGVLIGNTEVKNLISDSTYELSTIRNNIDLTSFRLRGSVTDVQVEVTIAAN
jgi:hypothetical protein